MNRLWIDKVRIVPVVHLATLWFYAVDSMRYPGKIGRFAKLAGTLIGGTLMAGVVAAMLLWTPEWFRGVYFFLSLYGVVLGGIYALRGDVRTQRRLMAQRRG